MEDKWIYALIAVAVVFVAWLVYTGMKKKPDAEVEVEDAANRGPSNPSGLTVTGGLKESYRMYYTQEDMEDVSLTISWNAPEFLGVGAGKLTSYQLAVHTAGKSRQDPANKIIDVNIKADSTRTVTNTFQGGAIQGITPEGNFGDPSDPSPNRLTVTFSHPFWEDVKKFLDGTYSVYLNYFDSSGTGRKNFEETQTAVAEFNTYSGGAIAQDQPSPTTVQLAAGDITGTSSASLSVNYPPEKRFVLSPSIDISYHLLYLKDGDSRLMSFQKDYERPIETKTNDIVIVPTSKANVFRLAFYLGPGKSLAYITPGTGTNNFATGGFSTVYFKFFEPLNGQDKRVTIAYKNIPGGAGAHGALSNFNDSSLSENSTVLTMNDGTLGIKTLKGRTVESADPDKASFRFQDLITLGV